MAERENSLSKLTAKEIKLLKSVDDALLSNDIENIKSALLKLQSEYTKQLTRTAKVLATSDKQQERLLHLNEKLEEIQKEQSQSISNLLEQKRVNAKNIIENKKKIFEIHKQELMNRQANIDELTQEIILKDEALNRLNIYMEENTRLKSEISRLKSQIAQEKEVDSFSIDELKSITKTLAAKHSLEFDILQKVNTLLDTDLNFLRIDHDFFTKHAIKHIQKSIQTLLHFYDKTLPSRELSVYIVTTYLEDILSVCADRLLNLIVEKHQKAISFVNFYNGQIIVLPDGSRVKKPEIKSSDGTRWTLNALYQVGFQHKNISQKIKEKEEIISKLKLSYKELDMQIKQIDEKLENSGEDGHITKSLHNLQKELDIAEGLYPEATLEEKEELEIKIQKLNGSIRTLRMYALGGRSATNKISEVDQLSNHMLELDNDKFALEKTLKIEEKRLAQLNDIFAPLDAKYSSIIEALAKTMASYELEQTDNKLF